MESMIAQMKKLMMESVTLDDMKAMFDTMMMKDKATAERLIGYAAMRMSTVSTKRQDEAYRMAMELSSLVDHDHRYIDEIQVMCSKLGKASNQKEAIECLKRLVDYYCENCIKVPNTVENVKEYLKRRIRMDGHLPKALVCMLEIGFSSCCDFGNDKEFMEKLDEVRTYMHYVWRLQTASEYLV